MSGCDDMFPTIDPMTFDEGERKGIEYPCHGEVCRVAHKVEMFDGMVSDILSLTSHLITTTKRP